jgi:imidazolonepropionase-like amidohydrolase
MLQAKIASIVTIVVFSLISVAGSQPVNTLSFSIGQITRPVQQPLPLPASVASHPVVAFVGVSVLSMTSDRIDRDETVIVRDGRIGEIGPARRIKVPASAVRVNGRGKYLMPGLIDMHVHQFADFREMLLFVANGITTVRNMAGRADLLKLRAMISTDQFVAPSFYTCGPLLLGYKVPGPVVAEVDRQCDAGYDCIKIYDILDWSADAYNAAVDEANRRHVPVVGHLPPNLPIEQTVRTGRQTVEHTEQFMNDYFFKIPARLDASKIPFVVKMVKDAGITVDPTLFVYHAIAFMAGDATFKELCADPNLKYIDPKTREQWISNNSYRKRFGEKSIPGTNRVFGFMQQLTKAFDDAGITLLLGTDSSEDQPFILPGFAIHQELAEMVRAGLTPYRVLQAGTVNAAKTLGGADQFGTVSVGKRADLLLLDANPLEDIANVNRRAGVMLRGHWLPRDALQSMMDQLAALYSSDQNRS